MIRSIAEDGTELSVNALPLENLNQEMVSVPVHFQCGYEGTYSFSFFGIESFDISTEIWLEDRLEDNYWFSASFDSITYSFSATPNDQTDRFIVHFFGPTNVNETMLGKEMPIKIYSQGNNVYIKSSNEAEIVYKVVVYDMMGRKIQQLNEAANVSKISIRDATGYYIVKVLTDKNVYTEKVFITK